MPNTPILAIPQVAPNQASKEVTINDAILALESAMGKGLAVSFASASAVTLSVAQITRNFLIKVTDATAACTLTIPDAVAGVATARVFAVANLSAWDCTVKSSSTSPSDQVLVPSLQTVLILADGPVIRMIAKSVPNGELRDMTDVQWTSIGDGKVMIWDAGLNKFRFITPLAEGSGVPAGGSNGQVLTKVAGTPAWANIPAPDVREVPEGGVTGWVLTVADETAETYQWQALPAGIALPDFLVLTDTPDDYADNAGKLIAVKATEDGLEFVDAPVSLPAGGTDGQVLAKASETDGDAVWIDPPVSVPEGGTDGQVLSRDAEGDAVWADAPVALPTGGTTGQVLAKASATDGDAVWIDPPAGSGGGVGEGWPVTATGTGVSQAITLPTDGLTVSDVLVFVNGLKWAIDEYSISTDQLTITTNAAGDEIEIFPAGGGGGGGLPELPDITGNENKVLAVKADGTGVEWITVTASAGSDVVAPFAGASFSGSALTPAGIFGGSISRTGVGDYTLTFHDEQPDIDYTVHVTSGREITAGGGATNLVAASIVEKNTKFVRFNTCYANGAVYDTEWVNILCFPADITPTAGGERSHAGPIAGAVYNGVSDTILNSFGITSIVKTSAGQYTVTLTNPLAVNNFFVIGSAGRSQAVTGVTNNMSALTTQKKTAGATTTFQINTAFVNGNIEATEYLDLMVFSGKLPVGEGATSPVASFDFNAVANTVRHQVGGTLVRTATGVYEFTFTTPMPDNEYYFLPSAGRDRVAAGTTNLVVASILEKTTNLVRFNTCSSDGTPVNAEYVNAIIYPSDTTA